MGVDNELYTVNQVKNDAVQESSLIDLWNRITPINSTRIGDTTVVNGKRVMNENKTFNTKPIEEISKQYADTKYETQDESAPYFYELENVDTGVKKYGIAPKGLEHRYAGQNMSQWKVNYNQRRTDAKELESLIHGNESMLKQSEVDLGFSKNTQIGKGASEIYTKGLDEVDNILTPEQKALTTKLVGNIPNVNIAKPTTTENKSAINKLFGETLVDNLAQTSSDIRTDKKPIDMLSVGDYIPKEKITNEADLYKSKEFVDKSKNVLNSFGVDIAGKSDKEVADIILKEQSKYGFNLADMIYKTTQFADKDQQVAKDWVDLGKMYEQTDTNLRQVADATKAIVTDPFNLVALETMGLGLVPKAIAQTGAKKALESQVAKTALIGGLEGAAFSTADNLLRQKMNILAGEQQSYNPEKAWESTAIGAGVGGALGGAVGKLFSSNEQQQINNELLQNYLANEETKAIKPKDEQQDEPISEQLKQTQLDRLMGLDQEYPKVETSKKFNLAEDVALRQKQSKQEDLEVVNIDDEISNLKKNIALTKATGGSQEEIKTLEKRIENLELKKSNQTNKMSKPIEAGKVLENKESVNDLGQKVTYSTNKNNANIVTTEIYEGLQKEQQYKQSGNGIFSKTKLVENGKTKRQEDLILNRDGDFVNDIDLIASDKLTEKKPFIGTENQRKQIIELLIEKETANSERAIEIDKEIKNIVLAEPKLIEKKKQSINTKGGNLIDAEEVLKSKKVGENIEFEVSSPVKESKPLEGNEYVPTVNNPKKFKLSYGDEGRIFVKDASLLSYQGTSDQKATLKQIVREGLDNADDEVNRRLEFYDRDAQLRERYGRTEAKYDERLEVPKSKAEADRLRFQIEQYKDIRDNADLATKVRREAKTRLKELYEQKKPLPKAPDELATKAEQKFIEENPIERIADNKTRDEDLREEFRLFKQANDRNKEGYVYKPSQPIKQVFTNTITNAKAKKLEVVKAIQKVTDKERRLGNKDFNINKITPEVRERYRDDVTKIENYTGAVEDVMAYEKGLLTPEEFMFRARRRVDDEVANAGGKFKSDEEMNTFIDDVIKKYDETGTKVTREQVKVQLGYESKGGIEPPDAKKLREDKEKLQASKKNAEIIKKLKEYSNTGIIPRYTSGQQAGKQALNSSQMRDVKDGILSFEEIANKTSPITTNAERKEAIKTARELAAKKVNLTKAKKMGIKGRLGLPENIIFKDTVKDASNSVAQIITVLLGSKRLASLSKLLGTNDDIRSIIGAKMEQLGAKLPKDNKGNTITWKDVVKPLFMTENYGQMEKGLIQNLMKAHNMSKDEATELFRYYEKASDDVAPEMKEFKQAIYDLYHKEGKAKLSWTLPDGFVVNINLSKNKDGTIRIRDNELKINVVTDDFDKFSRAIMPRMIHSVDAYIARRMNKEGFPTVHDAWIIPKGKEQLADDTYTKIMTELNDSDLLHSMMTELGYKGKPLKTGDLTKADIEASPHKLGFEHRAGESEPSKFRERELGRQLTDENVMRDYMASKNYRQIPTGRLVDALVNEAGYNNTVLSVARESDDPFERQVALAFQSPNYNPIMAVEVPKGVDAKMWNKVQEEIFHEARAKLEYHPWLAKNDVIQGERKWFNKDGRIIGKYNKTYAEIYEELYQEFLKQHNTTAETKVKPSEKPLDKVNFRFNKNSKFTTTINGITNKETFVKNVDNIVGKQKNDVVTLEEAIIKSKIDDAKTNIVRSKWQSFKTLWNEQINVQGKYKEFNLLQRMKNVFASEVDRDAEVLYKSLRKIPKEKQDDMLRLLKSDYEAIEGMTKKRADKFFEDNKTIYTIAGRHIDKAAKGLSSQSEHYGAYLNNPTKIAAVYDLPEDAIPIINQLISIKAMNDNDAWKVVDKYSKKDEDIKYMVDIMRQNRMTSEAELFYDAPEKMVKGYFAEVYRGNKRIDENGKVVWDAESKYEQGILGAERENNKIGTKVDIETPEFKDSIDGLNKKLDWMEKNRLKQSEDGTYRKVAKEDIRIEAGKINDLAHILTETVRATKQKVKERGIIAKVLEDIDKGDSKLFSKEAKDGFTKLTFEQLNKLPFSLRSELKYVDDELLQKLLGREEVRIYKGDKQHYKIADRLLSNLGTMFKQNVVLKNVTSYTNAVYVNLTLGATIGITPNKMYQYQKQALVDLKEMVNILEQLNRQKVTGQKIDRQLSERLKNNQLYQLERAGLSTNRVDGVVGDNDLLGSILEKHMPSPIFKMAQKINLNQNTKLGEISLRTFSKIDTMGRYMVAKKYMDDGMDIISAAEKANGFFGNMDIMVPPIIELLDKYGLAPFLKWFSLTHPMLFRIVGENPKKALAVAIGVYLLGQETDTSLASANPMEGAIDFIESQLPFGTIEKIEKKGLFDTMLNRARSNVVPRYISSAYKYPETLGLESLRKQRMHEPKSEKSVDYRGFIQRVVEGATKRKREDED